MRGQGARTLLLLNAFGFQTVELIEPAVHISGERDNVLNIGTDCILGLASHRNDSLQGEKRAKSIPKLELLAVQKIMDSSPIAATHGDLLAIG
jgi:hypothetical protein